MLITDEASVVMAVTVAGRAHAAAITTTHHANRGANGSGIHVLLLAACKGVDGRDICANARARRASRFCPAMTTEDISANVCLVICASCYPRRGEVSAVPRRRLSWTCKMRCGHDP